MVDERRPMVNIFAHMPAAFRSAYMSVGCHWAAYNQQALTRDDIKELAVLWQLTRDPNIVCARLAELAPGGAWLIERKAEQQSTTGGHTDGE